jgi:hypothetical protein
MKITELPDDILQQIFLYSSFYPLHALGYHVKDVMDKVRLCPKNARWLWEDRKNRYVPFKYQLCENSTAVLYMNGKIYPSSSEGWVRFSSNCYSPQEYQTYFREEATPDMAPRIHTSEDPRLEISYRGRRSPHPIFFQEGQEVDVMDSIGEWWKGSMVACRGHQILYHYEGWDSKWDVWYPMDSLQVAPLHSITKDWRSTLREGDRVDFKDQNQWYEARICSLMTHTVMVIYDKYGNPELGEVELSSERLMFHGAHTWFHRSPFRVSEVTWKDKEGVEVYQYRMRGDMSSKTVLVDRLLSEGETRALFS